MSNMVDQKMLTDAAEVFISSHLWKGSAIFIFVYVVGSAIKRIASIINEFVQIHTDCFGIGATIYYENEKYIIRNIGMRKIELYIPKTGESKYVRTSEWIKFELVFPNTPTNINNNHRLTKIKKKI